MRKKLLDQLPLTPAPIDHVRAAELVAMSALLDTLPEATTLVHDDLCWRGGRRVDPTKGREGLSAEQILRIALLKQHTLLSYDALAFALADSNAYRTFCRIGFGQRPPTRSSLQKNVKRVQAQTWEAINNMLTLKARELGIEDGKRIRTDCTVVESNIHHPADSVLLGDCVRVFTRLMRRARKLFGLRFSNHRLRAKRRVLAISNAKSAKARVPLYKDLVAVTESTLEEAESIAKQLDDATCTGPLELAQAQATAAEIRALIPLANQVIYQTESRVFRGETVPASEKIVSIFEPHTDIIVKGGREVEYGHKVCLTTGTSALVTDVVVEQGNPADSTLAKRSIERHQALFGVPPSQACFDGGFATRDNVSNIKAMGVTDIVFHKRCGIEVEAMASSTRVYKKMRAFRAGIEGTISFLKRAFGLGRCSWRGFDSFRAYVHCGVLSCNLLVVARHVLAARS